MYETGFALILTQKGEHQSKGKPITPATKQITMTSPSILTHYGSGNLWNFVVVKFLDIFYYVWMNVLFACLSAHLVPSEFRRGHWIPSDWSFRWLYAAVWVLRNQPRSCVRAASVPLSHLSGARAISPEPESSFQSP